MNVKANIDKKFQWRLALIAVSLLGISSWFLYDGTVTYPRQRERALQYEALMDKYLERNEEEILAEWRELAKQRGWPTEAPDETDSESSPRQRERALEFQQLKGKYRERAEDEMLPEWRTLAEQRGWPEEDPGEAKSEVDILFQRIIAALAAVPGFLYLVFYVRARGKWIEVNENQLSTSWGRQFPLSEIVSLNKKKWASKGIAKVTYQQNGRKRRVVLDDWKFEAEPTKAILLEVESKLDPSQIVGGAPEPVPQNEPNVGDAPAGQEAT